MALLSGLYCRLCKYVQRFSEVTDQLGMAVLFVTPENPLLCAFLMENLNLGIAKMSVIPENPLFPNPVFPKTSVLSPIPVWNVHVPLCNVCVLSETPTRVIRIKKSCFLFFQPKLNRILWPRDIASSQGWHSQCDNKKLKTASFNREWTESKKRGEKQQSAAKVNVQ